MTASKDTITTVLGGIGAVITAAQPVVSASQGNLDNNGIVQLILAVVFGLFGFFTNKQAA